LSTNDASHESLSKQPSTSGDRTTAMDLCNRYLFTGAVGIVLLEFVSCFFQNPITSLGLQIHPRLWDIPLLFGLLVLLCGNFNFYKRLIEPRGETPGAALYSLVGMLAMASLPALMFLDPLLRYRFLILGCYAILVVIKNEQLRRRFQSEALGKQFERWRARAFYQTVAALAAGGLYFFLFVWIPTGLLMWLTLAFNVLFGVVITIRFITDQEKVGAPTSA